MQYQKCKRCSARKPISEYYKSNRTTSGYRGVCKSCHSKQAAARYVKTKTAKPRSYTVRIPMPTQERLQQLFDYNANGTFTRLQSCGNQRKGTIAKGKQEKNGYKRLLVDGSHYLFHRIVWMWHYGHEPEHIDHVNGIRKDNRIENLRSVSRNQNCRCQSLPVNNTSGFFGVSRRSCSNKYSVKIAVNSKTISLGNYFSIAAAISAYNNACIQYHGEFGKRKVLHNIREAERRGIILP